MSIRVYRYGLLAPTENATEVRRQMRAAHNYRNTLVEIERGRRAALRVATSAHGSIAQLEQDVATAQRELEAAAKAIKDKRASTRSRSEGDDLKAAHAKTKENLRTAKKALYEARSALRDDPKAQAEADAINERATELIKSARAHSQVYWGTYLLIEDEMRASRKAPLYDGAEANDPRFVRWDGSGSVGVQIQAQADEPPFLCSKAFGTDTRLRIDPVDEKVWNRGPLDLTPEERRIRLDYPFLGWGKRFTTEERIARWRARPEGDRLRDPRPRYTTTETAAGATIKVHAVDRYLERIRPGTDRSEARTALEDALARAWQVGRTDRGEVLWIADDTVLVTKRDPTGELILVTVLSPEDVHAEQVDAVRWRALRGSQVFEGVVGKCLGARTTLRMRIGSNGRMPVWAAWPMMMQRPMPSDGVIKRASVHVRRIGVDEEWWVTITVEEDDSKKIRPAEYGTGAVAVDLGWRQLEDGGIRVAFWRGDDGRTGEIKLSARDVGGFAVPERLRGIRDEAFNGIRTNLVEWLKGRENLPAWLKQAAETLPMWRSPERFSKLVECWARFEGDEDIFGRGPTKEEIAEHKLGWGLEGWRVQDRHLLRWEAHQRQNALQRRLYIYRVAAARLREEYKTLVLEEDFDLRDVAKRPKLESKEVVNETARYNRQIAAPSELRYTLINAFTAVKGEVKGVPAKDSTITCATCGVVQKFDKASSILHRCECGAEWDQDDNATVVLLARWKKTQSGSSAPGAETTHLGHEDTSTSEVEAQRPRAAGKGISTPEVETGRTMANDTSTSKVEAGLGQAEGRSTPEVEPGTESFKGSSTPKVGPEQATGITTRESRWVRAARLQKEKHKRKRAQRTEAVKQD